MSWTLSASGTTTPTVGTTWSTLATDTTNATYVFVIDMTALALGDLIEVQITSICLTGGAQAIMWDSFYQHVQITPLVTSPSIASDISIQVMINQSAGTARAFPWKLLRV